MPLKTTITVEAVKGFTDDELTATETAINANRTSDYEAEVLDEIHAERKRRGDAADRKRLANLLDLLAEYVMNETPTGALTFGEGVNAHEIGLVAITGLRKGQYVIAVKSRTTKS